MQKTTQNQLPTVHCKVVFCEEIRRLQLFTLSFDDLHKTLRTILPISPSDRILIKYKDDEGDLVTISSDIELESAIHFISPNDLLRLFVFVDPISHSVRNQKDEKVCRKQIWQQRKQMRREMMENFRKNFNAEFEPRVAVVPISNEELAPLTFQTVLKNAGEATWPIGSKIQLRKWKAPIDLEPFTIELAEPIGPGASLPISFTLKVPRPEFKLKWKVVLPDGTRFGKFVIKTATQKKGKKKCGQGACRRDSACRSWVARPEGENPTSVAEAPGCRPWLKSPFMENVRQLKEMGFERHRIFRAMKECGGNVELALAVLLSQQ